MFGWEWWWKGVRTGKKESIFKPCLWIYWEIIFIDVFLHFLNSRRHFLSELHQGLYLLLDGVFDYHLVGLVQVGEGRGVTVEFKDSYMSRVISHWESLVLSSVGSHQASIDGPSLYVWSSGVTQLSLSFHHTSFTLSAY